jgi:hypothetical protein
MGPRMNRRPVISVLGVLAILATALPAHAQDELEPAATIRLVSQTPWTTPKDPVIRLRVLVHNESDTTMEAPELRWGLGDMIGARDEYEAALVEGLDFPDAANTMPLLEPLEPDGAHEELVEIDTSAYGAISPVESGVYPLQLELLSAGTRIVAVTTAAIHIVQPPQKRVRFSWWTEVDTPVAFAPDGRLHDERFEDDLEAGEGIVAQVAAIAEIVAAARLADESLPIDVVVSPAALDQLEQASDGYRRATDGSNVAHTADPAVAAAETLQRLREIAEGSEVTVYATPFAAPRLPSLLPGLRPHLTEQWSLGDETFERLVGEAPDLRVARPPGLALDEASLDALADRGVTTILGAPDSVERATDPLDLAPAPAARIATRAGTQMDVLLPDPSTQALLADRELHQADPVRAAQVILGELATIWRELPVPADPQIRGLALDLPRDLPAGMWGPLLRRVTRAPFLEPVSAQDLPSEISPAPEAAVLDERTRGSFSSEYEDALFTTGRDVVAFASIVQEPLDEVQQLRRWLLYAEAAQYIGNETSGQMWIDAVNFVTDRTFEALAPDTSRVLTFTSRSGRIPLRMGDPGERVVQVRVELRSTRVDLLDTGIRTVLLDQPNQVVTFDAEVKAAGRSSIEVLISSPDGVPLSRSVLVVSSTALNPIALIITVGAGLVLVGLWSRRLFRRRTR